MQLDPMDMLILNELMKDGRASFREIARRASLSTPTVSSRFERMSRAGLIKKFVPVFESEASENAGVAAIVSMSAPAEFVSQVAEELQKLKEVNGLYIMTGRNNLLVRVSVRTPRDLQRFLTGGVLKNFKGVQIAGSQIVTETVKDDHPLPFFADSFQMKLSCDFCKGEVASSRPYTIRVGPTRYYFCCKTCRRSYLDKYSQRIKRVAALQRERETDAENI